MNKGILVVVLAVFSSFSWGQTCHYINGKEILIKNRVSRVQEYQVHDSVRFKKEHPNGYYAVFNEKGQLVERNNYDRIHYTEGSREYQIRNLFDEDGIRIGEMEFYKDSVNPLKRIYFYVTDTLTKKRKFSLLNAGPGSDSFSARIEEEELNTEVFGTTDTSWVNPSHAKVPAYSMFEDSTSFKDVYFNKNGRIDSIIELQYVFSKPRVEKMPVKTYFNYAKDGRIKRKIEHHLDYTSTPEPYLVREFYYFDNGLVKSMISKHRVNTEKEEIRFSYQFRKK